MYNICYTTALYSLLLFYIGTEALLQVRQLAGSCSARPRQPLTCSLVLAVSPSVGRLVNRPADRSGRSVVGRSAALLVGQLVSQSVD